MSDQDNGIQNSPFDKVWPTPDVSGTGLNGTGGGLDATSGPNGITNSPFDKAVVPVPGMNATPVSDFGGNPPDTVQVEGGSPSGSQAPWDITSSRNTVDRK